MSFSIAPHVAALVAIDLALAFDLAFAFGSFDEADAPDGPWWG